MMRETIKIGMLRGAGIAFPVASLLYVSSGRLVFFALLPAGALIGVCIGVWFAKYRPAAGTSLKEQAPAPSQPAQPGRLARTLFHSNPWVRAAGLYALGALLMLAAWVIAYFFLPEGAFRGGAEAHMARAAIDASSASVIEEWGKIFRANLAPAAIILLGSLLIRVNGASFGYLVVLVNFTGYGLYLGTNSFAVAMPARMAPTLEVLQRSGPYEMLALALLAAASFPWARFEVRQLFRTELARVSPTAKIARSEAALALLALGILAAANWVEASAAMAAAGL